MGLPGQIRRNLQIFPTLLCSITPLTFITTYILAVYLKHVYPILPYISETGTEAPESCIFSQFLNIAALLLGVCVYVRSEQVNTFANFKFRIGRRLRLNTAVTYLGYSACLGLSMVANFQVNRVKTAHYLGASLCFFGGTIYFVFQAVFSYHMCKEIDGKNIFITRCCLCFLSIIFSFSALLPGLVGGPEDSMKWSPGQVGYTWHVLSTSSEWFLSLIQSGLVLTFLPEFRNIVIHSPEIYIEGIN